MRLDKYLKVSRLIKRRTVANEACDASRITVNGKNAKASYDVKLGDIIEVTFGQRTLKIKVLEVLGKQKKNVVVIKTKEALNLEGITPECMMVVGYPADDATPSQMHFDRRNVEDFAREIK